MSNYGYIAGNRYAKDSGGLSVTTARKWFLGVGVTLVVLALAGLIVLLAVYWGSRSESRFDLALSKAGEECVPSTFNPNSCNDIEARNVNTSGEPHSFCDFDIPAIKRSGSARVHTIMHQLSSGACNDLSNNESIKVLAATSLNNRPMSLTLCYDARTLNKMIDWHAGVAVPTRNLGDAFESNDIKLYAYPNTCRSSPVLAPAR